jgi:hypothetical protein
MCVRMYVCMCMYYVCMHVIFVYVCSDCVCVCVFTHICMYARLYVSVYVCIYALCLYVSYYFDDKAIIFFIMEKKLRFL